MSVTCGVAVPEGPAEADGPEGAGLDTRDGAALGVLESCEEARDMVCECDGGEDDLHL